jgi:tetratricopeptide (TPR) repeat protein
MENDIEELQEILEEDPSNFQIRRELSILLANQGFNEEALANLQYLTKYFPEDAELQYNIGILHEKSKDFEAAKKSYQKAIELSPQNDFYYNLGEVLVTLKEWNEAIEMFKKVLKTDPIDGNCYFNIGLCYFHLDEINLATDNFQKAVDLNPQDLYAHFYLGNIYQSSGLTNFAADSYNKVLEISPDYSWAYYNLASIAYGNNNLDEARDYLEKTIQYNKNDIEAYKLLTKICMRENNTEEIIEILSSRLEDEDNGDLYYILAQVFKHMGQMEDYKEYLEEALDNGLTLTYPRDVVQKECDSIELEDDEEEDEESDEE